MVIDRTAIHPAPLGYEVPVTTPRSSLVPYVSRETICSVRHPWLQAKGISRRTPLTAIWTSQHCHDVRAIRLFHVKHRVRPRISAVATQILEEGIFSRCAGSSRERKGGGPDFFDHLVSSAIAKGPTRCQSQLVETCVTPAVVTIGWF